MPRMTPEEAEDTARIIEALFADLQELRTEYQNNIGDGEDCGMRTHVASARVALLNLLDVATEQDLKGTALSEMPEEWDGEKWEWTETAALARAIDHGMSALVRDLATLRGAVAASTWGRELDVKRFRMAWVTLSNRLIKGEGATVIVEEGGGGEVNFRVHFEPPMANPFKEEVDADELTGAQILVGNMMSYAFTRRNQEG